MSFGYLAGSVSLQSPSEGILANSPSPDLRMQSEMLKLPRLRVLVFSNAKGNRYGSTISTATSLLVAFCFNMPIDLIAL